MAQETHFINCPHCSAIIELVCPRHDATVNEVLATTDPHYGDLELRMNCPKCKDKFTVVWRFF